MNKIASCHLAGDLFKNMLMAEIFNFWIKRHWTLFPMMQLTTISGSDNWRRMGYCLNRWWRRSMTSYGVTRSKWVKRNGHCVHGCSMIWHIMVLHTHMLIAITGHMMTSSNGNIFRVIGPLSAVNYPHKGQWRGALMFSLICAWINGWINNCEPGGLKRHRAHYDVIALTIRISYWPVTTYLTLTGKL